MLARTRLNLAELYRPGGAYWFSGGWNWRAVLATAAGAVVAVGGAYSAPGSGPFPADGLIPWLKVCYDYSWVAGLVVGFVVHIALSLPTARRQQVGAVQGAGSARDG